MSPRSIRKNTRLRHQPNEHRENNETPTNKTSSGVQCHDTQKHPINEMKEKEGTLRRQ